MIGRLIRRELSRGLGGAAWLPAIFFLIVAAIVPFAVGPDAPVLARIGPGALWIAALTSALLPIERLVEPDRADGVLDQLALCGTSEEGVAAAKIIGHWLAFGPLMLLALLPASALVGLPPEATARTALSLVVGTPALAALAVAAAALTSGLGRASSLAGILLLPLAVPLVIFGASAASAGSGAALKLEAAIALFMLAGAPFVAGAAIRASRT